jgi:uncharacterized protein YjbI with pentapeptide repeats
MAKSQAAQQQSTSGTIGPNMRQLAKTAQSSASLETSVDLDVGGERVTLAMMARQYPSRYSVGGSHTHYQENHTYGACVAAPTFEQGMRNLAQQWPDGQLQLDTIEVHASKCPLKRAELRELATAAWCEAYGVDVPSSEELARRQQAKKADEQRIREEMFAELKGGAAGVKKWNARKPEDRQRIGKLRRLELSGAKLDRLKMNHLDVEGTIFDGASLTRAEMSHCQLQGASFKDADLTKASLLWSKASEASFEGARLVQSVLAGANLRRTNFQNANLEGADLGHSDLCGANFSGANLKDATFSYARYDEQTQWPAGFVPPKEMKWAGKGPAPGSVQPSLPFPSAGPLDFIGFMERLAQHTDQSRLSKALQMLKADRFQLFAECKDESVTGVVRSQTDAELVYSCRLSADGGFACCTQNLNACGGLRGALCKHLLVLIVGLTKAGQLDPATVDAWVQASRARKPELDKDVMSETFLRYKGAEAGEVDWRPTETIPEDYYAL